MAIGGPVGLLLACLSLALALGGCTLPKEQLGLPGPITGSIDGPPDTNSKPGVPLSDAPDYEALEPQVYRGTGEFVSPGAAARVAGGRSVVLGNDGDGVSLNFSDASIREVARAILGDILELNYSVSDKVSGKKITLRTASPIPRENLLDVVTGLFRDEGAAIVYADGLYRILPSETAGGGRVNGGGRDRRGGVGTEIVPLRYVDGEEMKRIVGSIAPQATAVLAGGEGNVLLATGTPNELQSIRETVAAFDVDWMRGMSFGLFPIESADPTSIASELDKVFANDRRNSDRQRVRFVPMTRLKAVLVIAAQPDDLLRAEDWIRRIDLVGQANEKQVHVYRVQNRPAGELAKLLQQVYTPDQQQADPRARATLPPGSEAETLTSGTGIASQTTITTAARGGPPILNSSGPQPIPTFAPILGGAPRSPEAVGVDDVTGNGSAREFAGEVEGAPITTGSLADPSEFRNEVPDDRRTGIQVVPDDTNNALIITATAGEYRRIRRILSRIDIAPSQVLLEATIAEITLNDQLQFGLRWFFRNNQSTFSFSDDALGAVLPQFPGFSYFLNTPNVQVALNALSDITDVNIVSSPSLMVLDNKTAVLQIGDEVPIATQSAVSVITPDAPIVNAVSFRNTGVILSITPRIGDNGRVLLDIEQEVSDVVPTTSSNIDSPTIQQRRIKTTVAVGTGESIVLAGFMQDRANRERQQVPILGDVPVVGNLFKSKDDTIRRTELLIAITPQVVNDPHQIRGIAAEFRDRLNFRTRPQRRAPPDRREQIDRLVR